MKKERQLIGEVGVDSGQILMTDPWCVFQELADSKKTRLKVWETMSKDLDARQLNLNPFGLVVRTDRDGGFPVYLELNENLEPTEIIIKLKG